jgi:hypothetical protein
MQAVSPPTTSLNPRWLDLKKRVHAGEFSSGQNHGSIRNTLPSIGPIDGDTFERLGPMVTTSESLAENRLRDVVNTALEARDILGTSDEQVIPGFKEYLFPESPKPLKGFAGLKRAISGERGIITGFREIFVERRIGRGFAKVLASAVFMPFQAVAVLVDSPRLLGDHIVLKSKQIIVRAIASEGIHQSLLTMAGGAMQALGGMIRLSIPVGAMCLGIFAGGWPGVLAAALFEGVYFGEDLAKLSSGEVEEMLLFQGLRDIVGGIAVLLGAEFITSLKGRAARKYIEEISPEQFTKLGLRVPGDQLETERDLTP